MTNQEKYMGKLEGKIALITGGNGGIGFETAKQFVNEGAYVFITAGPDAELVAAVKEIGKNVIGVQGELSNLRDLDRLFAQIKREKRRLDIVFVNPGVEKHSPLGRITNEGYRSIFDINVKGLFFTVQKALPLLPDGASIILNAFVVATHGKAANGGENATRGAVRSFGRMWTTDLKERRIRVNAVNPGPVDTPGLKDLLPFREAGGHPANRASLRRFGTPEEIAEAVVFLASDDSRHITGTELFVGGGSMSGNVQLDRLGTAEEVAEAVVFLASDDSRHITGTELFVGAGFAQL
jgi:NAD(P)-dependent dehydrogenase (short-subunit alcohol dehydrogenase family)